MADSAFATQTHEIKTFVHPERIAWGVLLVSFAIFCTICVVTGLGVHYFLFGSTVPLNASIQVGTGTAIITGTDASQRPVQGEVEILNGSRISTDSQSQATLSYTDPYLEDALLASMTVRSNTAFLLRDAARPRFDWTQSSHIITLRDFSGEIEINILQNSVQKVLRVDIWTSTGHLIRLDGSGRYRIDAADGRVRVINQSGTATMVSASQEYSRSIPAGQQGVLFSETAEIQLLPAYTDLLRNSTFTETVETRPLVGGIQKIPVSWACGNGSRNEPPGTWLLDTLGGRAVMHLTRGDDAISHGETRCQQLFLNETGNLTGYNYLALRATFMIRWHSLSGCGIDASECPIMLRLDYVDTQGQAQIWRQGFYTQFDPFLGYPLLCNSCIREHRRIYPNAWYTFESDNLFTVLPENVRPQSIISVTFYASGHQWDVYIGEMSLLVGQQDSRILDAAGGGG